MEEITGETDRPTLCIMGKIEGGVEVVDEATGADVLSVTRVVLG